MMFLDITGCCFFPTSHPFGVKLILEQVTPFPWSALSQKHGPAPRDAGLSSCGLVPGSPDVPKPLSVRAVDRDVCREQSVRSLR